MGCDLRKASEETKKTLLNKDLIAINQDLESRGAYVIKPLPDVYNENEAFTLVKPLADGDLAIGIFNFSDTQRELSLEFWGYGYPHMLPGYPWLCMTASQEKNWANLLNDLHRLFHPMDVW